MEHAIKIAAAFVDRLPKDPARPKPPRQARVSAPDRHLRRAGAGHLGFIVRDFIDEGLREKEALLEVSSRT